MRWIRLRQVALVAHDLEGIDGDLHEAFGLEVAFRDPGLAKFGLHNAVLPVGNQFIRATRCWRRTSSALATPRHAGPRPTRPSSPVARRR
jgi:hypothetical protein